MSEATNLVTLYVTFPNHDDAVRVCTNLISNDLIACANIIEGGKSLYKWDGAVNFDDEVICFMKTHADCVQDSIAMIKDLHTYEVPCITQMDIVGGNPDYLKWVRGQVIGS